MKVVLEHRCQARAACIKFPEQFPIGRPLPLVGKESGVVRLCCCVGCGVSVFNSSEKSRKAWMSVGSTRFASHESPELFNLGLDLMRLPLHGFG